MGFALFACVPFNKYDSIKLEMFNLIKKKKKNQYAEMHRQTKDKQN